MTPDQIARIDPETNPIKGMTEEHRGQLEQLAGKRGEVIIVRPVSEFAQQLIEEGHPTKSLHMKGKSSDWGPQAGFIPVDQSLSKIADPEKAKSSSQTVADMLEKHRALTPGAPGNPSQIVEATPLVLTGERIASLESGNQLARVGSETDGTLRLRATGPDGVQQEFLAKPTTDGKFAVSRILDGGGTEPLMVVGTKLPGDAHATALTADYDVLAVCPPLSDYGMADRVKGPNADLGNVSSRLEDFISDAVSELETGQGRQTVHHGPDTHNPYADLDGDFRNGAAMTVFLPGDLSYTNANTGGIETLPAGSYTVNSKANLVELMHTLRENGYQVPRDNPAWSIDKEDRSTLKRLPAFKEMEAKMGKTRDVAGVESVGSDASPPSVREMIQGIEARGKGNEDLSQKTGLEPEPKVRTGADKSVRELMGQFEKPKTPAPGPKQGI